MRHPTLIAVLACSALAACGGDEPLSRAEYIKQADAICADYAERQSKIAAPKSVKDVARVTNQSKQLIEERLGKLRELEPPDEIADQTSAAYDQLEEELPKIDQLIAAAEKNDRERIQRVAGEIREFDDEAKAKLTAIGVEGCGG